MKKLISVTLISSLVLPSVAYADSAESQDQPKKDLPPVVYPLSKGQAAPYSGVLFSQAAAANVVADKQTMQERVDIAVKSASEVISAEKDHLYRQLDAQCKSDVATRDVTISSDSKRLARLETDLGTAEKKAKDAEDAAATRPAWAGIGFASGVILTVASVFAISLATK